MRGTALPLLTPGGTRRGKHKAKNIDHTYHQAQDLPPRPPLFPPHRRSLFTTGVEGACGRKHQAKNIVHTTKRKISLPRLPLEPPGASRMAPYRFDCLHRPLSSSPSLLIIALLFTPGVEVLEEKRKAKDIVHATKCNAQATSRLSRPLSPSHLHLVPRPRPTRNLQHKRVVF